MVTDPERKPTTDELERIYESAVIEREHAERAAQTARVKAERAWEAWHIAVENEHLREHAPSLAEQLPEMFD